MEGFTQFRDESGKVQMIINKFNLTYIDLSFIDFDASF